MAFVGALAVTAALTVILRRTSFGLSIRAVASNPGGAALVGVNVGRVYALTFGIGAGCVAVAGGLLAPLVSLTPSVGEEFTILAFVIVVLGGLGNVVGAMVGGLLIGLVQTVGSLYLPGSGSLILVFAVFVLTLFLRPQGIFGGQPVTPGTTAAPEASPTEEGHPGWARDRRARLQYAVLAAFMVLLAVMPYGLTDRGESIAVRTLIIALLAVGWNLMSGYGGLFSFGHAAFFGVGAYTDAYLVVEHGISPWVAMALGAVIAALAGTLIAFLCLRYRLAGRLLRPGHLRLRPALPAGRPERRGPRQDRGVQPADPPGELLGDDAVRVRQLRSTSGSPPRCSASAWRWSSASPTAAPVSGSPPSATTRPPPSRSASAS